MSRSSDDDGDLLQDLQDLQDRLAAAVAPAELGTGATQSDASSHRRAGSRTAAEGTARCGQGRARVGRDRAVRSARAAARRSRGHAYEPDAPAARRRRSGASPRARRGIHHSRRRVLHRQPSARRRRCAHRGGRLVARRLRPKAAWSFCYEANTRIRPRLHDVLAVTKVSRQPRTIASCVVRSEIWPPVAGLVTLLPSFAFAAEFHIDQWLEEVVVIGKLERLGGEPSSATVGTATSEQLDLRPVLRTGELLEVVPGLIVTQHSGSGKANQYFLRGFNLDHGTDLVTSVDGVPVNMPTHAHGQGYTDINFVIPELVESIEYRKGTYYADTGNFSAAGAVNLRYRSALDAPFVAVESAATMTTFAACWPRRHRSVAARC